MEPRGERQKVLCFQHAPILFLSSPSADRQAGRSLHWLVNLSQIPDQHHQRPGGEPSGEHQIASVPQHHGRADCRHHFHQRREFRLNKCCGRAAQSPPSARSSSAGVSLRGPLVRRPSPRRSERRRGKIGSRGSIELFRDANRLGRRGSLTVFGGARVTTTVLWSRFSNPLRNPCAFYRAATRGADLQPNNANPQNGKPVSW
jgi:hypothetical protein